MPFPAAPGSAGGATALPLSMRAMPVVPRSGVRNECATVNTRINLAGEASYSTQKQMRSKAVRDATIADDQRQIEMDFVEKTDLEIESSTDRNVAQVEEALGDLARLTDMLDVPHKPQ